MATSAEDLLNIVNSQPVQPAAAAPQAASSGTDANTLLAIVNGDVKPADTAPAGASAVDPSVAGYMKFQEMQPDFLRNINRGTEDVSNTVFKGGATLLNKAGLLSDQTKENFNKSLDDQTNAYNAKYGDTSLGRSAGQMVAMPPVGNVFKAGEEALPFLKQAVNGAVQGGAFGLGTSSANPEESPFDQTFRGALAGSVAEPIAKTLGATAKYVSGKASDIADYVSGKVAPKAEQAAEAVTSPSAVQNTQTVMDAAKANNAAPSDIKPEVQQAIAAPSPTTAALTPDQRMRKAEIESLGIPPRSGAITGNAQQQIEERENAKLAGQGEPLRQQFLQENSGLVKAGNQFTTGLGGTAGSDPIVKGQAITNAFQGLEKHYDQQVGQIYDAARAKTGDAAVVNLTPVQQYIEANKPQFLSSTEGTALLRGLNSQIKQFNGPLSINDAESFRQFLNSVSSPQNYKLVKGVKAALDDTVAQSGGADIFKAARALRADQAKTLENPAPIARILGADNGGNRAISDEKIPDYLATLPLAQLRQVKATLLTKMPTPKLQQAGQQAWNELRTHMGENIVQGAQPGNTINELGDRTWSAPAFTKNLNKYTKTKLSEVFTPPEMQQLGTIQRVGNYVAPPAGTNTSNTASQLANFLQSGAVSHIPVVGGFSKGVGQDLEKSALNKKIAASIAGNVTPAAEQAATNQSQQRINNIAQSPISAQAAAAYANMLRYKKEDK